MSLLWVLVPAVSASVVKFLTPLGGALTRDTLHTFSWTTECTGGCSALTGSFGKCSLDLLCSPDEYMDFSLNDTEIRTQAANWSRLTLVNRRPIPSPILSSKIVTANKMSHSVDAVFGLVADVTPSSACMLELSIQGTTNISTDTAFWVGFHVLNPVSGLSWPSGHSYKIVWEPAPSRNWAELSLFKGGEVISLHPTEDSIGSPSKSDRPWCINSGSCWVFIPDVSSDVSYTGLSGSNYQFRVRQFYYDRTETAAEQAAYLNANSIQSMSDYFEVQFNLSTFYKDTSIVVYSTLLTILLLAGLVAIGIVRHRKRKAVLERFIKLQRRQESEEAKAVQGALILELAKIVILAYFQYFIEELVKFEKRRKQWTIRFLVIVVPLMKTTYDICYDIWQYYTNHPHPIFIVDIAFQIIAHVARLRYQQVRLTEMRNANRKLDELSHAPEVLVQKFQDLLGGGSNSSKLRNISTQTWLEIIQVTCDQINGIVGILLAAHLDLTWTDWSTSNALLQIKLLLQVLAFNWNFLMAIREIVNPLKEKMGLLRTANAVAYFGVLFVIQRNVLLGVIYAGVWHNPTLSRFGINATLALVIVYMLLSPLSELLYFVSNLIGYVFQDVQTICTHLKGHTSDHLETLQAVRDANQSRINKKIGFYGLSVITQVIFLLILNLTNTFDYTTEAYYVRVGVTIYVCLSNVYKIMYLFYSALFCRCCGWAVNWEKGNLGKQANHCQHACCCIWTAGLWAPFWISACCHFGCLTPCGNCCSKDN